MSRRAALVLSACLLATACGDDPDLRSSPGAVRTPTAAPDATEPAPAATEPAPVATPVFAADTGVDEKEPVGGPLSVTAVRVARQDGYDRVVFELDGRQPGEPGWRVEYVDEARQDGSGNPVEVEGDAVLAVRITGAGYPFDTGVEEQSGDPAVPGDVEVVQDVVVGSVFEGVFEAFVGVSREAPFRVFRLADPARVVVDVRHG